jgi:hypothetical protein
MTSISRLAAAARRVLGATAIFGMLATSALAIFVIAILFGVASKYQPQALDPTEEGHRP